MKWNKIIFISTLIFSCLSVTSQNVGIGVNNPQQKLHVGGNIRIDGLANNGNGIIITDANGDLNKINLTGNASDVLRGDGTFGIMPSTGLPSGSIIGSINAGDQNLINAGFSFHGELNSPITLYEIFPGLVSEQYSEMPMYETGDPAKIDAPSARIAHSDLWTGSEFLVWGGYYTDSKYRFLDDGSKYNPSTDSWAPMSMVNAPSKRAAFAYAWTGTEAIIWGGIDSISLNGGNVYYGFQNTGKRYNPVTNAWQTMSMVGAPSARYSSTSVWSGTYFVVWGGSDANGALTSGARYNPATNTWSSMSLFNAPPVNGIDDRMFWTGTQAIVLGDYDSVRRYNPATNTWVISAKCPAGSYYDKKMAVWTGSELWVYHSQKIYKYNPSTNAWTTTNVGGFTFPETANCSLISAVWADDKLFLLVNQKGADGKSLGNKYYTYSSASNSFGLTYLSYNEATNANCSFIKAGSMLLKWGGALFEENYDGNFTRYSRRGIRIYLSSGIAIPPVHVRYLSNNKLFLYKKS